MTTVLIFLAVLIVLILVHELGHFLAARAFKVKVLEFGLGYPPRLLSFRKGGTVYSLNALPLGGFVKLMGEEDPTDPESLAGKGILTRVVVLGAGSFMNALLPIFLFALILMIPQQQMVGLVQIQEVAEDSPAALAGLESRDIVLEVDGHKIQNPRDLLYRVQLRLGGESTWVIKRGPEQMQVRLIPRWNTPPNQGPTGVQIGLIIRHPETISHPFWQAIPMSIIRLGEMVVLVKNEITRWFIGSGTPQLAGPIGIAQVTGHVAQAGFMPLLELTALLSINLAIINIMPIPMLDGGRLVFVAIEWIRRGKRISPEKESFVHFAGLVMLLTLVAVISYFDILRILRGESLLP